MIDELKAMGHDALIGLPALACHELEQRPRLLPASEEQIEELVHERLSAGSGYARQHHARDLLEQTLLKTGANSLKQQRLKTIRPPSGQVQRQHAAERDPHHGRSFQAEPVEKFRQVVHEVRQIESAPQRETIVFAAQLVADDLEIRASRRANGPKSRNHPPSQGLAPMADLRPIHNSEPYN